MNTRDKEHDARELPIAVTVVRDRRLYGMCVASNPHVQFAQKVVFDNTVENLPIPVLYNRFLDSDTFGIDSWLMFCHEDFEIRQDIRPIFKTLRKDSLYGPVGSRRKGFLGFGFQQIVGAMTECRRSMAEESWLVGKAVTTGTKVETLDCCCLIVHASLVRKHHLRFDENLLFDLYVEDFCATAKLRHGVATRIIRLNACHHSGSQPTERLYRHLPYLEEKYPHHCFSATCAYFGSRPPLMRLEDWLTGKKRP